MASAAVSATMAASGFEKRSDRNTNCSSTLQTPGSGTFPSTLRSPSVYSPGFLRKEEALKTPITPPSAYLDFLKNNMSPAILSPMPTGTSTRFSFNERSSFDRPSEPNSTATSQPALSRNTSYNSDASSSTTVSEQSITSSAAQASANSRTRPESPRITIPQNVFVKPGIRSARTPRRLHIPQSPFSPALNTATSAHSPYSSTPLSAVPWSASFSPRDTDLEANSKPGKVSVRHVVTRTVTYCRTPLEPAPRGKRRKLDCQTATPALSKVAELPGALSEDDEATPKKSETVIKEEQQEVETKTIDTKSEA